MHLADFVPDADTFLELEPEELGILILRVLASWPTHQALQLSTFINTILGHPQTPGSGPYPTNRRGELQEALCTAWAWLEGQALLIRDTRYSEGVVKLSSRGKQIAGMSSTGNLAADGEISEAGRKSRFERWEQLGLDVIKTDLEAGGHRLVGGPPAVRKLAREWVRMKEAQRAGIAISPAAARIGLDPSILVAVGVTRISTVGEDLQSLKERIKHVQSPSRECKVFINYRRNDEPGFVHALFSQLVRAFAADQLFMDVDNIPAGADFVQVLEAQVSQCDAMLVVIGQNWLDARGENGDRRLDDPNDFVRIEIESALKQGKRVIPVLVHGARMPRTNVLPESLQTLARRNAVRLTHERFASDVQGLIEQLQRPLETKAAS